MPVKLNVPARMITISTHVLIRISYDTSAAEARRLPRKAYLELADQPAKRTP